MHQPLPGEAKGNQPPSKKSEFMSNRQRNRRPLRRKRSSDYPSTKHRSTRTVQPEAIAEPPETEPEAPSSAGS